MILPRLRYNVLSLGAVQAGNFLVPLLTLPYLTRTLGVESYGQVVWVQTIMLFGGIFVDFGFGWSATRSISLHRHEPAQISQVFANTWAVQWILAGLFAAGLWLSSLGGAVAQPAAYFGGLGIVLGQVLLPMWLFQGLESLRAVAVIQLVGRLLALPLVFIWVQGPSDQVSTLLFFSTSSVFVGVLSLVWVRQQGLVQWVRPNMAGMCQVFGEAALLFLSRALISLYTTLIPLAVGWWAGTAQLAYFNLADRLRAAVQALLSPISQALFPRMSWLFENDVTAARQLLRKTAWWVSCLSLAAGWVLWLFAEPVLVFLGGSAFSQAAKVLRWLAFVPWVVVFSNLMGIQIMLPLGMNKPFSLILGCAAGLCLLGLFPMIHLWGAAGAAQLVLLVECSVTTAMAVYLGRFWRSYSPRSGALTRVRSGTTS